MLLMCAAVQHNGAEALTYRRDVETTASNVRGNQNITESILKFSKRCKAPPLRHLRVEANAWHFKFRKHLAKKLASVALLR